MAAAHHGHIICLYAGRAVYCPKMATLQATLKAALECFGLENTRDVHFGFPHSDLAILVEISSLAFKNVRDGAILYLCDGTLGPVYPHELAHQAQQGQVRVPPRAQAGAGGAAAARAGAAIAAAAAAAVNEGEPVQQGPVATTARVPTSRPATRSSRRLRRQPDSIANTGEAEAEDILVASQQVSTATATASSSSKSAPPEAVRSESSEERDDSATASTSAPTSAKRIAKREPEDDLDYHEDEDNEQQEQQQANTTSTAVNSYFKKRKHTA